MAAQSLVNVFVLNHAVGIDRVARVVLLEDQELNGVEQRL
jgi:hypothetical protein